MCGYGATEVAPSQERKLETAAATAAETASRGAASTKAGASGRTRSGGKGRRGLGGHGIETIDEAVGEEGWAKAAALVPLWRLSVNVGEGFAPVFLDAEGHGEGEKFFKHLGSLDHAIEAVGLDMSEKIFETEDSLDRKAKRLNSSH